MSLIEDDAAAAAEDISVEHEETEPFSRGWTVQHDDRDGIRTGQFL